MKHVSRIAIGLALGGLLTSATACSSDDGSAAQADAGVGSSPIGNTGSAGNGAGNTTSSGSGGNGAGNATSSGSGGNGAGNATSSGGRASTGGSSSTGGGAGTGGTPPAGGGTPGSAGGAGATGGSGSTGGGTSAGGQSSAGANGWLYTKGNKIYVTGNDAKPWMGRGVNIDDIFYCGYNGTLWMDGPGNTLKTMVSGLMSGWKPNFIRLSLSMASYPTTVSWLSNPAQYKTVMVDVIKAIGSHPNTYVLVTLRSDKSMISQDQQHGDPEATGIPSDATTSPDKSTYPTGTDAVYKALVNDFKDVPYVLFGITNEPGGNLQTDAKIAAAMGHAAATIRAEEDRLGTPHHLISVQGNSWTSNISFFASKPLTQDNVVYEVHGYPPTTGSYTYSDIPVIIGEYGTLSGNGSAFFADLESKSIPNLAWDFDPFSNCAPDLLNITTSATSLTPSSWGKVVQAYLLAHSN